MPLDATAVRCAAYEINENLAGGRIEKIYQPERDEIVLIVKNNKSTNRLVISANSQNPRIYLTREVKENPSEPPMFCMLMRKHILSGKIISVESVGFERVCKINVLSRNEMGDAVEKHIMCEIMGKNSNIILVDENEKIIDSVKHVDLTVSRVRNVFPGLAYRLPPDADRKNPLDLTKSEIEDCITLFGEGKSVEKAMTASMMGLSPLLCREAAYRAIGKCNLSVGEMKKSEQESVAAELFTMMQKIKDNDFDAVVLYKDGDATPMDFAAFEITQYGEGYTTNKRESISEAMEEFYQKRDSAERMRSRSYALMKNMTSRLEKIRKKLTLLHTTLQDASKKEKYRVAGDIITANLYRMKQGDKILTAVNYYDEACGEIEIELNEALSPSKNAQAYYKKYQKAKVAEVEAAKQIEKAEIEADYFESVIHEIEEAKTPSELDDIKEELTAGGVLKTTFAKKKQKRKVNTAPVEYLYKGYKIYAGRNNIQNDYLTLKIGRANDLWLHTKTIPGSHVLIKNSGEDFPPEVIEAAAVIAATNSKGKKSPKVEVDYCPVSHVKKPNGAKSGMVVYEGYSTAVVNPDEAFCEKLLKAALAEKNEDVQ